MNNVLSNMTHYLNRKKEIKKIQTENFRKKHSFEDFSPKLCFSLSASSMQPPKF